MKAPHLRMMFGWLLLAGVSLALISGGAAPAHSHQLDDQGEFSGVAIHITAECYDIASVGSPTGSVNVGNAYEASVYSQHYGTLTLTGSQANAFAAFASQLTEGAGDNGEVFVDEENYEDTYDFADESVISRNGPSAHNKAVEAATTGISQTPGGQLSLSVGDPHTVIFEAL